MADRLAESYLENAVKIFRGLKVRADKAIAQVNDEEFFRLIDAEANSIALVIKHLSGNMRSRWTDFLTSDGEKPDRDRDSEFVQSDHDRAAMIVRWEEGWRIFFAALESLKPEDLTRTVTIRGEPHTVVEAINRQLVHYGEHVGQIILLAKHFKSADWQTLSIARNKSGGFNEEMARKHPARS